MRKAIFLDRDGVINENVDKLIKPEQFKLLDGVIDTIKKSKFVKNPNVDVDDNILNKIELLKR